MGQHNTMVDAFAELAKNVDPDWKLDKAALYAVMEPPEAILTIYNPGIRMIYSDRYKWDGHAWLLVKG